MGNKKIFEMSIDVNIEESSELMIYVEHINYNYIYVDHCRKNDKLSVVFFL